MECTTQCVLQSTHTPNALSPVSRGGSCFVFGAGKTFVASAVPGDIHCCRKRKLFGHDESKFNDYDLEVNASKGVDVKAKGHVLRVRRISSERGPNVICKVELFAKIVGAFDDKRRSWVIEMGFGGLLNLANLKLPRSLCYWLMTRVDHVNERLVVGGISFRLSCNQVRWVLGLPKGAKPIPSTFDSVEDSTKVFELEKKFQQVCCSYDRRSGKQVVRRGLAVTPAVIKRLQSNFEDDEILEFKMLFLLVCLDMVLCPTQSSRFPKELLPALGCAAFPRNYNWCALVLDRLMGSAKRFADRFYEDGYVGGCGGCTLFLVIFYLDRLKRNGLMWGVRPRVKVWSSSEINSACIADRPIKDLDYGSLGVIDVAYGEDHPLDARDLDCSSGDDDEESHV